MLLENGADHTIRYSAHSNSHAISDLVARKSLLKPSNHSELNEIYQFRLSSIVRDANGETAETVAQKAFDEKGEENHKIVAELLWARN